MKRSNSTITLKKESLVDKIIIDNKNAEIIDGDPALAHKPFDIMDQLVDKLNLLNYSEEFIKAFNMRRLHRLYFAIKTNTSEQFDTFSKLAAWLIQKCGGSITIPQENSDPHDVISTILKAAQHNKLKEGWSEHVIILLDELATLALRNVKCLRPSWQEDFDDKIEEELEEPELVIEQMSNFVDSIGDISDDEDLHKYDITIPKHEINSQERKLDMPFITGEDWKIEAERMIPTLTAAFNTDPHDWRYHLRQLKKYNSEMQSVLSICNAEVEHLFHDLKNSSQKIESRENFLNFQLKDAIKELNDARQSKMNAQKCYEAAAKELEDTTKEYRNIMNEIEDLKKEIKEKSSSVTNDSPLLEIRKTINTLEQELKVLNVRLGVAEQASFRYSFQLKQ